jgi:ATP-dependent Clp protease, protease subunit
MDQTPSANKSWYNIKSSLPETGPIEVYIDNEIGEFGISARQFLNELKPHAGKPVRLHINSPGGSLIDAFAIYDFVKLQGYHLSAYISGIAASAATVVAAAAKESFIGEHSYFFIHNPYYAGGKSGGQTDLDKMKNDLLDIYHRKTGLDKRRISAMMDAETLLNAEEALEMGFVDGIVRELQVAALLLDESLKRIPDAAVANRLAFRLGLGQVQPQASTKLIDRAVDAIGLLEQRIKQRLYPQNTFNSNISKQSKPKPNMENIQALEQKLEELIQQLNDLLTQLASEPNAPAKETPQSAQGKAEPQKTVENLERELQRLKARRIDTGNPGADTDPARTERDRKNGWNYVSSYLQNRF